MIGSSVQIGTAGRLCSGPDSRSNSLPDLAQVCSGQALGVRRVGSVDAEIDLHGRIEQALQALDDATAKAQIGDPAVAE
jgi:hypothetical protein